MGASEVIAGTAMAAAFLIWALIRPVRSAAGWTAVVVAIVPTASHFAYPDRYSDAMWLIGAVMAFAFQMGGVLLGGLLGAVVRIVATNVRLQ